MAGRRRREYPANRPAGYSPLVAAPEVPPTSPATATTTSPATAAEPARTLGALLGLIYAERATVEHDAVHRCDRLGCLMGIAHRHEAEAARLTTLAIGNDMHVRHVARGRESSAQRFSRGAEGKVPDIESIAHGDDLSLEWRPVWDGAP